VRLLDHLDPGRIILEIGLHLARLRVTAGLLRVERTGAKECDSRSSRPADVRVDRVLQSRTLTDEFAVSNLDIDEIPVETGVEASRETAGDVRSENALPEQHRVVVGSELGDDVDARLRKGRGECVVARCDVNDLRAVLPEPSRKLRIRADDHRVRVAE
jgi:hypothetical protein